MDVSPSQPDSSIPDLSNSDTSQRALLAARRREQNAQDAKQRKTAGIRVCNGTKGKTAALVANQFGVSTRQVELALVVLRYGDPELVEWVEYGEIPINLAIEIIRVESRALALIQKWLELRARAFPLDDSPEGILTALKEAARPHISVQELQHSRNRDPRHYAMPRQEPPEPQLPQEHQVSWRPCAKV